MTFREFIFNLNGYVVKTTFWEDFSIADQFGLSAIQDTYNRSFESWKDNLVYITELVLVLNHKIWYWYEKDDDKAKLYDKLWRELDEWCCNNLSTDDLQYYYKTLD